MGKIPKLRILSILIAAAALMALIVVPVLAQPPVTSPLSGAVTIDGADAPAGTTVDVFVGTETTARATVITTTAGYYEVVVMGTAADVGKALTFKVDDVSATSTPASPTFASYAPQSVDLEMVTTTEPPTVVTTAATNIGTTTARTNGSLTDLGSASTVACYFQLGTTTAYGSTCGPINMTSAGTIYCNWSFLSPDTTYHFRTMAVGDGTDYGDDMTFTTEETPPTPGETFAWWLYETFVEPLICD